MFYCVSESEGSDSHRDAGIELFEDASCFRSFPDYLKIPVSVGYEAKQFYFNLIMLRMMFADEN